VESFAGFAREPLRKVSATAERFVIMIPPPGEMSPPVATHSRTRALRMASSGMSTASARSSSRSIASGCNVARLPLAALAGDRGLSGEARLRAWCRSDEPRSPRRERRVAILALCPAATCRKSRTCCRTRCARNAL
jgi:hypothetical protein